MIGITPPVCFPSIAHTLETIVHIRMPTHTHQFIQRSSTSCDVRFLLLLTEFWWIESWLKLIIIFKICSSVYVRDGYLQILERKKKHSRIESETSKRFIFGASMKNVTLLGVLMFIWWKLIEQITIIFKPNQ